MTRRQQISDGLRWAVAAHYNTTAKKRWEELASSGEPNWSELAREAIFSGLGPLLFASIKQLATREVPDHIYAELRRSYFDSATQNLLIIDELGRIDALLKQNGVSFIILKGPALLVNGYASFEFRPMSDLDLLIAFEDVARSQTILEEAGYRRLSPFPFEDESGLCFNEMAMTREDELTIVIEIHWRILNNPYFAQKLPTADLFSRSTLITVDGASYRSLSPTDQLFHLSCHHIFHHQRELIRTGPDIAFLIKEHADSMNWAAVKEYGKHNKLLWPLRSALVEASELWFAEVPSGVMKELSNHKATIIERFFVASQGNEFAKAMRTLVMLPGIRLKFRFLIGQLFPRRDYMAFRYGTRPTTPLLVAYIKRYLIGARNLVNELF